MKALIALILLLSTCQAHTMELACHATGTGSISSSYEDATRLIETDYGGDVDSYSFLLAFHGYSVPEPGLLILNNTTYAIGENGSLAVA